MQTNGDFDRRAHSTLLVHFVEHERVHGEVCKTLQMFVFVEWWARVIVCLNDHVANFNGAEELAFKRHFRFFHVLHCHLALISQHFGVDVQVSDVRHFVYGNCRHFRAVDFEFSNLHGKVKAAALVLVHWSLLCIRETGHWRHEKRYEEESLRHCCCVNPHHLLGECSSRISARISAMKVKLNEDEDKDEGQS